MVTVGSGVEKNSKKFEKSLDEWHKVCYNKYVIKRDYKIKNIFKELFL